MGALVGLGVGVGLVLVWSAFFVPRQPREPRSSPSRSAQLLARAGMGEISVASLVLLCVVLAVTGFAVSRWSHAPCPCRSCSA
jgi:tight adherence protein B